MSLRLGAARLLSPGLKVSTIALGLALAFPGHAVAAAAPVGVPSPEARPAAPSNEYSFNLYQDGDFVSQYTAYWCIGASMQMMLNIVGVTDGESRASQESYMRVARSKGPSLRQVDHGQSPGRETGGAGSGGWAAGLGALGAGRYDERALDDFDAAVQAAARALRTTDRPVGLIVWRGAHAWVMSGFTATADPLVDSRYRVTGVYVQDPWYPRVSSIWGAGQKPNSWLSIDALRTEFLPRRGGRWHPEMAGKFVLVVPVDPPTPMAPAWRRV